MLLLAAYVALALGVSFLCSLLEATLLATRASNLVHQRDEGKRGAGHLLELKQNRLDDAISAILILNTVSNTLGATMAGAQAGVVFENRWVGVFSGVLTLGILIFSEIIPKTLGAVYPRQLAGFTGWVLYGLTRSMAPVLYLSRLLTRVLTRDRDTAISRDEITAFITTASREGVLSADESRMVESLLRFNDVRVEDVMTPRTVVYALPVTATIADLLASAEANAFSRIPLYRDEVDDIAGYVLKIEVLRAVAAGVDRETTLQRYLRNVSFIPELATVGQALRQLASSREHLAMTTDEHGSISGLVTLEDLMETVLGFEIVDESDETVDMRQRAARLREQRLARMRRKRQLPLEQPSGAS